MCNPSLHIYMNNRTKTASRGSTALCYLQKRRLRHCVQRRQCFWPQFVDCRLCRHSDPQISRFPVPWDCTCRDFVPIHICHHSLPALSTRFCRVTPTWNRSAPRPLHLKMTSSASMHPVLTTLRFPGAGGVGQGDSIHAQNAPPHPAEMGDESAMSKGKPPNCTTFVDQVVPGLLTTLLGSGNTPGMDYGALAKIQNPWRRRRTLPEGV